MSKHSFPGRNLSLPGHFWCPVNKPKAVVLALHGMGEHAGRYDTLAEYLVLQGIALAAFDVRGHGQHTGDPQCAAMDPEDWMLTMDDIRLVLAELERLLPGVPQFLLGLSMGSFLVRDYMATSAKKPAGIILIGTNEQPAFVLSIIKKVVQTQINRYGFEKHSPLVQSLAFDAYNRKIHAARTSLDWLCADEAEVDRYLKDPLRRSDIACGLFYELLDSMARTGRRSTYELWPKNIPVLLLAGQQDPVCDHGKGIQRLCRSMERAGLTNVISRLYPGARHVLLREEASGTAETVRVHIAQWIAQHS